MKITLLCSDIHHPIRPWLQVWKERHETAHEIEIIERRAEAAGGDFLFLISCHEIIGADVRQRYGRVLVIHASDLPERRGWSPHVWAILAGESVLTVSLLEADDAVDSGDIWSKVKIRLTGTEVCHEINRLLFDSELELMDWAIANRAAVRPEPQDGSRATYVRRRMPEDSRVDPDRSVAEQFDLLRTADPERYPAFFDYRGRRFKLVLEPFDGD